MVEKSKDLVAADIIRSELNIEKWNIWVSPNSNAKPQVRIIEREMTVEDQVIKATVKISFTHLGNLTTFDQKVFYALIKIWEESGETENVTFFSLNELARKLQMGWGSAQIKVLKDALERLRITPFLWKHSFFNAKENKRLTIDEDPFHLITKLKTITREEDGRQTKPLGYFQFHPLILSNLRANYRKPVLFNTILSFKSDHAQMIYSYLDLVLSKRDNLERNSIGLFEDLGITSESYKDKRRRKSKLNQILPELQNKPLSNGRFLKVTLAETKAKDDVKIICVTLSAPHSKSGEEKTLTREENLLAELKKVMFPAKKAKQLVADEPDEVERQLENLKRRLAMIHLSPLHSPHKWLEKAIAEQYPLLEEDDDSVDPQNYGAGNLPLLEQTKNESDEYVEILRGLLTQLLDSKLPETALRQDIENKLLEIIDEVGNSEKGQSVADFQEQLQALDQKLLEETWQSLDQKTRSEIEKEVANSLGDRRSRLTKEMLESEIDRISLFEMRKRYNLPTLTLFEI